MAVFRGSFPGAPNIAASYTEPNQTGEKRDIDAPRNAPAKSPILHLDKVAFHSSFYLYEVAVDQVVTITHPAISGGSAGWEGYERSGSKILVWEIFGRVQQTNHAMLAHGLGYAPLVMVSFDDAMIVAGTIVQNETAGTRFVSVGADSTYIYLSECGYSSDLDLPAADRNYRVLVFRTPSPNPALPMASGAPDGSFQIGRGMIDSAKHYLRRDSSLSPLDMDIGRTVDIEGGGARVVTGGNVQTDQFYTGSFGGSPFIPVNV